MQCILLKIHQYRVQIIYKPGPQIFIADWLSWHNHKEGKDKPIKDMDIRIDAIQCATDIPECISISQIQQASTQDEHLQCLKNIIITGWPSTKDELHSNLRPYLVLQRWPGGNRWSGHEGQAHNHTSSSKTTGDGSAPSESHGYWKNKVTHAWIHILGWY